MGIRVGYEPVASIGGMAVQSGRNTYEKWLAEQRRKALEMQQQAQLQAQQIAADKEKFLMQAKINAQNRQQDYERQTNKDYEHNLWQSAESDKQRKWQEAENEKTRKYKDSTAEEAVSSKLAGISAAFGDNPLAQSTLTPELKGAYDNAASVAGSMADDNFKGMLQGLGPLQQPPEDADTSAFKRQYTPSQKRELESIYISKDKIENDGELSKAEKAYALDKLLQRRDQILRSPVPVLPEKSPIRVEKLPNGIEVIIDQNGGIHEMSKFDGEAKKKAEQEKQQAKEQQEVERKIEKWTQYYLRQTDDGTKQPIYTPEEAERVARWHVQGASGEEVVGQLGKAASAVAGLGKMAVGGWIPGMADATAGRDPQPQNAAPMTQPGASDQSDSEKTQQLSIIKAQMVEAAKRNDVQEVERLRAIGKQLVGR